MRRSRNLFWTVKAHGQDLLYNHTSKCWTSDTTNARRTSNYHDHKTKLQASREMITLINKYGEASGGIEITLTKTFRKWKKNSTKKQWMCTDWVWSSLGE